MYGHRNVESEGPIVEHVDSEEHECNISPFAHWYGWRLQRQGGCELGEGGCESGEDELGESDQETCRWKLVW